MTFINLKHRICNSGNRAPTAKLSDMEFFSKILQFIASILDIKLKIFFGIIHFDTENGSL